VTFDGNFNVVHCAQLEGGIHRYLESYPDGGLFQGKNFVFDSRVAVGPSTSACPTPSTTGVDGSVTTDATAAAPDSSVDSTWEAAVKVVGRCIDCACPHDVYSGHIVCTVCRMPVLVCPQCVASNPVPGEYHCSRHRYLISCTDLQTHKQFNFMPLLPPIGI
jgi:predicted sulfurtransferase